MNYNASGVVSSAIGVYGSERSLNEDSLGLKKKKKKIHIEAIVPSQIEALVGQTLIKVGLYA